MILNIQIYPPGPYLGIMSYIGD